MSDMPVVDRRRWTDRFGTGTVFLVGDAAHIWIPMGGFGMNAGIADATNLSWKLSAAVDGWAGPSLLDSYEAERKPIGETVATAAVGIHTDLHAAMASAAGVDLSGHDGDLPRRDRASRVLAGDVPGVVVAGGAGTASAHCLARSRSAGRPTSHDRPRPRRPAGTGSVAPARVSCEAVRLYG